MPLFLFGDWAKNAEASLKNPTSFLPQTSVPNNAPPDPFIFALSNFLSVEFAATVLKINTSVADGFVSTVNFFKTPPLPEGFETAQPVSPAKAFLFSVGDSFGSLFGVFSTGNSSAMLTPPPVPAGSTSFDFDGDGKADTARFRASTGAWEIKYSGNNTTASGTLAAGKLAPADYDGDGKTDLASFNNGTWNILKSSNGQTIQITGFGQSGDIPVSGNYVGSAAIDPAVYRPSNGTWYVREAVNGTVSSTQFGASGDIAAPGNYDGDSVMDYAIFRPSNGYWYILGSTSGFYTFAWGIASDIPVPADFDGDGKTDCAVYRASAGTWYAAKSSASGQYLTDTWGNYGDQPVPADYDNDGKADFAIYRPTTGVWHTKKSNGGSYEFTALGTPLDTAVSSAYIKQVGGQVVSYDITKTRLSPKNATGGTDLYSRNFGWSSSLVGLSGRAGLDMGFGISYNSLVWTKHTDPSTNASTMYFDVDNSNISPGFRFGFPTIEPVYYDSQTGKFSYIMVSPSGARTEFKQIGASDTYETVDSSYAQLRTKNANSPNDPVEDISITVTGTDGTKMTYNWKGGAFRASQIKDRNGNFITILHDQYGLLQSVTDTLGRIVSVEYDSQLYPTAIKQTWKDNNGQTTNITHYWARFEYATININPGFNSSLGIYGPTGGASVKVLSKIKRADDGATVFEYQSNSFGQVSKIRNFAPDNHELNYVQTNLASPGTNLTDCPKLSQTKSWTENFNGGAEVVINNTLSSNQTYSLPDGHSGTAAKIEVTMANHPHGAISKTFVGEGGWMEALPIATEDWANGAGGAERKRWTWTNWTQDDTNLSYILNPRSTESKVGDTANIKKTTVEYLMQSGSSTISQYGLTAAVNIYDSNQSTVLKRVETDYNLASAYVSRRIIGLPSETRTYGMENSALAPASKTTYAYDEENFVQENNQNISSVIQHDNGNFSSSFIAGRGNLTSTTRHDVTGQTSSVSSKVRYDIAGSTVAQLDPLNRKVRIEYTDVFNDATVSRNTFAYPTKIFDPANNFSEVKYRFDTGANVWAKSPAPAGNTSGKETVRLYDAIGILSKETLVNTGAYTRYFYPPNGIQSQVFSTVIDANNDGVDSSDEVYSEAWTDGAGRVRYSRTEHPNSANGWSASKVEYDILGRAVRSTVPTEIYAVNPTNPQTWTPAGDDNRGLDTNGNPVWLWQAQEYDWKGRVTRQINTDGTDKLISYEGCGCAGGQVTTVQSELVPRDDQPTLTARRTQKIYEDILGRNFKAETLKWDGAVYSTVLTTFNRRDQALNIVQQDNTQNPVISQTTVNSFDGHGRIKTQHRPEQDANKVTTYNYNTDDGISSVTDARGATVNYTYNDPRGLLTNVSYAVPQNSTIQVPAAVAFSYDNLGNRTQMSDGLGTQTYTYDQLSRMTSETRVINDTATGFNQSFTFNYGYSLTGQLTSFTDVNDTQRNVSYSRDKTGKVTAVSGSGFAGVTNYASNLQYRAFGGVKAMTFGSGKQMTQTYNNRLQMEQFDINQMLGSVNEYYADGQIKKADDSYDARYDRLYRYDYLGRVTQAKSGIEAADETQTSNNRPYRQTYDYNAFGNLTGRTGLVWNDDAGGYTASYANHRRQEIDWNYDADGRQTNSENITSYYDAAGRLYKTYVARANPRPNSPQGLTVEQTFDGDGRTTKKKEDTKVQYHISSSVLGTIYEIGNHGGTWIKWLGIVYLNGQRLAFQKNGTNGPLAVEWNYVNPASGAQRGAGKSEPDPLGVNAGLNPPDPEPSDTGVSDLILPKYADSLNLRTGCEWDGMPVSCDLQESVDEFNKGWDDLMTKMFPPAPEHDNSRAAQGGGSQTAGDRAATGNFSADSEAGGSPGDPTATSNGGADFEQEYEGGNVSFGSGAGVVVNVEEREPQNTVPIPADLDKKIVERLDANNGRCRNFLDKVRKKLKIKKTFEQLIADLKEDKGDFVLAEDLRPGAEGVDSYGKGGRNIGLSPLTNASKYVTNAIHELIHRAGVNSHITFAEAGYDALSADERKANQRPTGEDVKAINKAIDEKNKEAGKANKKAKKIPHTDLDDESSYYFSGLMNKNCGQ